MGPKSTPEQQKIIQSFDNIVNNIQTQQQAFRMVGKLRNEEYHGRFVYFAFIISLN